MVKHTCYPGTQEPEAGGLRVHGQPRLHSVIPVSKGKKRKKKHISMLSYLGNLLSETTKPAREWIKHTTFLSLKDVITTSKNKKG